MPFPVYFASNWKESVNDPRVLPAQYGFGFTRDGVLRLPERTVPNALRIVDDAILPERMPDAAAFARLASLCKNGCLLDFERRPTPVHAAILRALAPLLDGAPLFSAPERFLNVCPALVPLVTTPDRCANWKDFVSQAGKRHPNGWVLELIPRKDTVRLPFAAQSSGELRDAVCRYRQSGQMAEYFDTRQTVAQKLTLARAGGCRACIGLASELAALPP